MLSFNLPDTGAELNSNRKRNRIQEEEQPHEEMQVDEDSRAINELNDKELDIAHLIAQERIKYALFIHVDIPSTFSDVKNPIHVTNSPAFSSSGSVPKERVRIILETLID